MTSFKQFVNEAISKEKLFSNTDEGRKLRATYVKTTRSPRSVRADEPELKRTDFIVKSRPKSKSVEGKTHAGYIDHDGKGMIHKLYCSCKDFNYRLYYPLVKNDLATWTIDKNYQKRAPFVHNHEPTVITNPDEKIYVCKHLYKILQSYVPSS